MGGCAIVLWGKDFVKMNKAACLVLFAALLGSTDVHAVEVTCFEGRICSGVVTSTGSDEDACCNMYASYQTEVGVCCNCSEIVQVRFSSSAYTVSEGGEVFSAIVERCGMFEEEVNIFLVYQDITAQGGKDYGPFPTSILSLPTSIPANSSRLLFPINIRDNNVVDNPKIFSVSLLIMGEERASAFQMPDRLTNVTIVDDDFVNITVEPTTFKILESAENREVVFTVRKMGVAVRDVVVSLVSIGGTATSNRDFEELRAELTFAPEDTAINVTFTVLDDNVVEGSEDVRLVLVPGEGERGVVFPKGMGAVDGVILDDNDTVLVYLQGGVNVTESEGQARITAVKDGATERNVSVLVTIVMPTGNGMALATEGRDFNLSPTERTITFGPNDITKVITVDVYRDGIFERPESFYLMLEPAMGETGVEVLPEATEITIEDSDSVAVGFSAMVTVTSEAAGAVNVTVELLQGVLDANVEVEVFVVKETGDLAEETTDFSLSSSLLTFIPGGPTSLPITLSLLDDIFFEGREDFTLGLRARTPRVNVTVNTTKVSVVDNEDLVIRFQNLTYVVSENQPYVDITVTLLASIERDITLDFVTSDGRATAGTDYEAVSQTLTFTPTMATGEVRVNLLDDDRSEGLEDFSVEVVLVDENLGQPGIIAQAVVQILDNENIFVELSSMEVFVTEGRDNLAVVMVKKTGETEQDINIILSVNDGSAIGGVDYGYFPASSLNFTLSIPSEDSQLDFPIVIRDDDIIERVKVFTVSLLLPDQGFGGNTFIRGINTTTVFIVDDDVVDFLLLPAIRSVNESEQVLIYTVTRLDSNVIETNLAVNFTILTVAGSAVASQDYVANSVMISLEDSSPSSFTFNVTVLDDEVAELPENFSVVVRPDVDSVSYFTSDDIQSVIEITDDDTVIVDFTLPLFQVSESSGNAMVCLQKDRDTSVPFSVTVTPFETPPFLEGIFQARADFDFDPSPLEATFQPDLAEACVDVRIIKDEQVGENKEVFGLRVSATAASPGIQVSAGSRAQTIVLVNDVPDVVFGFIRSTTTIPESIGTVDVCVVVSVPEPDEDLPATLLVTFGPELISADMSDFQLLDSVLTFNNETRRACLTVLVTDDDIFEEPDEAFEIVITDYALSDSTLTALPSRGSSRLIILDDDRSVTVGFDPNSVNPLVDESDNMAILCVGITSPGPQVQFKSLVELIVGTRSQTATSADYTPISAVNAELILMLNSTSRAICFEVSITDDARFEGSIPETFEVILTPLSRGLTDVQDVIVEPAVAVVRIQDNDGMVFVGFEESTVEVEEDAGGVELCAVVVMDTGRRIEQGFGVRVNVLPDRSTAEFQLDFNLRSDLILFFNNTQRKNCFEVMVIDDNIFETETPEDIILQLQLLEGSPLGVAVADNRSIVVMRIQENDMMPTTLPTTVPTTLPATTFPTTTTVPPSTTSVPPLITDMLTTATTPSTTMTTPSTTAMPESTTMSPTTEGPSILPIFANDTLLGETVFSVPLSFNNEDLQVLPEQAAETTPNLCFEIQGRAGSYFNLLSDSCTSVNAQYSAAMSGGAPMGYTVISRIGILAKDAADRCIFIEVGVDNDCFPLVSSDGKLDSVESAMYDSSGVSVTKRQTHVRVSVPNCGDVRLVMYATCIVGADTGTPTIRFDITRGINLSPTSHGLMGQFWNVPIGIAPYLYTGQTPTYLDTSNLYAVTISPSHSPPRRFVGEYYYKKWDQTRATCFYAGNIQGGSLLEIANDPSFNSPVIEGDYMDYATDRLFHSAFKFSRFLNSTCIGM